MHSDISRLAVSLAMRYRNLEERIIANSVLDLTTDCWVWLGKRSYSRNGSNRWYPIMTVHVKGKGTRNKRVHHLALTELRGIRRPSKIFVAAHSCNNSYCVNPMHLRWALQSTNMKQCVAEGRHNSQQRQPGEDEDEIAEAA
jgi:hypothetical protein